MADFTFPRQEVEEVLDYDVLVTKFENGYEQRRARHNQALIGFKIKTPVRTQSQMEALRDFFISKTGALTAFTFESPFDGVTYNVRFEPGTFKTIYQAAVYQTEFTLVRVLG